MHLHGGFSFRKKNASRLDMNIFAFRDGFFLGPGLIRRLGGKIGGVRCAAAPLG